MVWWCVASLFIPVQYLLKLTPGCLQQQQMCRVKGSFDRAERTIVAISSFTDAEPEGSTNHLVDCGAETTLGMGRTLEAKGGLWLLEC